MFTVIKNHTFCAAVAKADPSLTEICFEADESLEYRSSTGYGGYNTDRKRKAVVDQLKESLRTKGFKVRSDTWITITRPVQMVLPTIAHKLTRTPGSLHLLSEGFVAELSTSSSRQHKHTHLSLRSPVLPSLPPSVALYLSLPFIINLQALLKGCEDLHPDNISTFFDHKDSSFVKNVIKFRPKVRSINLDQSTTQEDVRKLAFASEKDVVALLKSCKNLRPENIEGGHKVCVCRGMYVCMDMRVCMNV